MYASKNGIVRSICHFQNKFSDGILKKAQCVAGKMHVLKSYRNESIPDLTIIQNHHPRRRPRLLNEEADKEIQMYLLSLRDASSGVQLCYS